VIAVYEDRAALGAAARDLAALDGYELSHDGENDAVVARWGEDDAERSVQISIYSGRRCRW